MRNKLLDALARLWGVGIDWQAFAVCPDASWTQRYFRDVAWIWEALVAIGRAGITLGEERDG